MPAEFDLVTFDASDTARLASFWSGVLGLVEVEREDGDRWVVLGDRATGARRIGIQRINDLEPHNATWEGAGKGRIHLDLRCDREEFTAEVDRLVHLGATELRPRRNEPYGDIATLADPEGNVFDLCAYA